MARGADVQKRSKTAIRADRSDLVDDLTAIRAAVNAMQTKLDADGGVTDTDYASTLAVAALKTKK